MTLILELPDNQESALKAKALAEGVSAEQYIQRMIGRDLELQPGTPADDNEQPFWKTFTNQVHALPDEVFERLPSDGASEHDHYLYGSPKRNS